MSLQLIKSTDTANQTAAKTELGSWSIKKIRSSVGLIGFFVLIAVLNGHLLGINGIRSFLFLPHAVASGEWWRLLTFPFVHVSWYHLVLDVGAFIYLFSSIQQNTFERMVHVIICGAFSLTAAYYFSPEIQTIGLCGLSGIDHGLLAITSLGMIKTKNDRYLGYACLGLVIAKCVYEMAVGDVFFSSIHLGLCGTPLVACHLGGVAGGMLSFFLCRKFGNKTVYSK